jgi:hypothetical protein
MTDGETEAEAAEIARRASTLLGRRVLRITAPAARDQASWRIHLSDATVIVTRRPDPERAARERLVLTRLAPLTDAVPRLLAAEGELTIQSDLGRDRLSVAAHRADIRQRRILAQSAVASILSVQRAAVTAGLAEEPALPAVGLDAQITGRRLDMIAALAHALGAEPPAMDRALVTEAMAVAPAGFVRGDCRAGNAVLDAAGRVRWFDFEDAGRGPGAEDFVRLMNDETWPVPPEEMLDIIAAGLDPRDTDDPSAYIADLRARAVLHAGGRLGRILRRAHREGWQSHADILRRDRLGAHPAMAAALADRAAQLAAACPLCHGAAPVFVMAGRAVRAVWKEPKSDEIASPPGST